MTIECSSLNRVSILPFKAQGTSGREDRKTEDREWGEVL